MSSWNPYAPPQLEEQPIDAGGRSFRIDFELTEADVIAFQHDHTRRTIAGVRLVLRALGGLLIIAGALQMLDGGPLQPLVVVGLLLLLFGFWVGSRAQLARSFRTARKTGRRIADLGRWSLALDPSSISFSTPTMRCEYRWQALERVVDAPEYVFLYTSSLTAVIVPKRAFGSARDSAAFTQAADLYLRQDREARGEPPAAPPESRSRKVLLLWLLLILVFLAVWTLLSPERP